MPNYKKTKRNRFDLFKKVRTIPMHSGSEKQEKQPEKKEYVSSFKIVSGRKKKLKQLNLITAAVIGVLALSLLLCSLLSPTGIVEGVRNYTAAVSLRSNFPAEIEGSEVYNLDAKNRYFYCLSDTNFACYSKNGKKMFGFSHKMASPAFVTSQSRALLYDQNSTSVSVYTAYKKLYEFSTNFEIYCADIARNGSFAVATKSDNYTSMVTVYDKKAKKEYEWFCPDELISAVALSKNGKKLAVASVKAKDGRFVSMLRVLEFDSAEPVFTKEYDNTLIVSLYSQLNNSFSVITKNRCDVVSWKNYSIISNETQNVIVNVIGYGNKTVICEQREADASSNLVKIYNQKGKVVSEFSFNKNIDDFRVMRNNIFVLSGNEIVCINFKGETLKSGECAFAVKKIIPVAKDSCISVSDYSFNISELVSK